MSILVLKDERDRLQLVHLDLPGVRRLVAVNRPPPLEAALAPLFAELVERLDPRRPNAA